MTPGPSEIEGSILATARPKSLFINMCGLSVDIGSAVDAAAVFVKLESGCCCNLLGRASNPLGLARLKLSGTSSIAESNVEDFREGGDWSSVFEVLTPGDVCVFNSLSTTVLLRRIFIRCLGTFKLTMI